MPNKPFKEALLSCSALIQQHVDDLLPKNFCDSKLVAAMRYSALSGGKRIRPFLVMASAQIFGISPLLTINAATAIELIHVYSLIHDDLPAMDDDDIRRGLPSCHKKFDEATAILAGDALLTLAFELLADPKTHANAATRCELVKTIARAAGFRGMVGGQMIDLEKSGQKISNQELTKLHRLKTAELFMAAAEAGAILGGANDEERKELHYFADDLGLAFQIKDDISDQELGWVSDVQEQLNLLRNRAIARLKIFGTRAALLVELVNFLVDLSY